MPPTPTTPPAITADVLRLCSSLNPLTRPRYILVTPEAGCKFLDCFNNVAKAVEKEGRIQFGWLIWQAGNSFLQAEHHAVLGRNGGLKDITPQRDGEKAILFLPDDTATFDFKQGVCRPSVHLALDPAMVLPCKYFDAMQPRGIYPPRVLRNVVRNAPCPCGSKKKYKKCHGAAADAA